MTDTVPIRDAASVIVWREGAGGPAVLMGQRGAGAAFMPNKYVFPGGALDANDALPALGITPDPVTVARLAPANAQGLVAAAIRELWEETGQILGRTQDWSDAPQGWRGFAASGHTPAADALRYVFRAITPAGRPRRFDARFFLVPATALTSDPDDFSGAEDELLHLHWVPIAEARMLNLPFITEVVLAEVAAFLQSGKDHPDSVPFFDNSTDTPAFLRIQ